MYRHARTLNQEGDDRGDGGEELQGHDFTGPYHNILGLQSANRTCSTAWNHGCCTHSSRRRHAPPPPPPPAVLAACLLRLPRLPPACHACRLPAAPAAPAALSSFPATLDATP